MECFVCREPLEQWQIGCGLHPSHTTCLVCFFRRWFTQLLPELDDLNAFSGTTHFLELLTHLNVRTLGDGPHLGTLNRHDSLVCDFDKMPLRCWSLADRSPLGKYELWPLLLQLTQRLMLPEDGAFVDRCLQHWRHLYQVNETVHAENGELLRSIMQQQLQHKQQERLLLLLHNCLLRLKIHTSTLALNDKRDDKLDRVVNHLLMLANNDLDEDAFQLLLDEFEGADKV